ncbi:MAG TPA: hypothetical protein VK972_10735 [Wenzhouxiangella sp.]|nr:hypothetical protein [Wenzhouxiangella sp.]
MRAERGRGLVLQNNGGDDPAIAADGSFTFATPLADGSSCAVTVATQPTSPSQTCTVANGSPSGLVRLFSCWLDDCSAVI